MYISQPRVLLTFNFIMKQCCSFPFSLLDKVTADGNDNTYLSNLEDRAHEEAVESTVAI
jgi:hypothetical protein